MNAETRPNDSSNFASEREKVGIRNKTLHILSGFDSYLRQYKNENIIDMYGIEPFSKIPIGEEEALVTLSGCLAGMRSIGLNRLPPEWGSTYAGIVGVMRHVREREPHSPRSVLLREIGGVETKRPMPESLTHRKLRFVELLEGITGSKLEDGNLREAYAQFQEGDRIAGDNLEETLKQEIQTHAKRQFQAVERVTGIDFSPLYDEQNSDSVRVVIDNADAPWTMWSMRGPDMRREVHVNSNERQLVMLGHGSVEGYTWHEDVMHLGSNYAQMLEIKAGRLDPIAGYLLIPGPQHLKEEANAMRGNHLVDDGFQLSHSALLFQENYGMYVVARASALHDMDEFGLSVDEAGDKYREFVFLKPYEYFLLDLKNGSTSPFWSSFFEQYRRGEEGIMEFVQGNRSGLQSEQVMRTLLTRPMTPSQMGDYLRVEI